MKKATNRNVDDMKPEYDFSTGERGRYAKRFEEGTNLVLLAPDVAKVFPDAESVNAALRVFVRIAKDARPTPSTKHR